MVIKENFGSDIVFKRFERNFGFNKKDKVEEDGTVDIPPALHDHLKFTKIEHK